MATPLLPLTNLSKVGNFIYYIHHARISSLFVLLLSHARILSHFPLHCLALASRLIPTTNILGLLILYSKNVVGR